MAKLKFIRPEAYLTECAHRREPGPGFPGTNPHLSGRVLAVFGQNFANWKFEADPGPGRHQLTD